MGTWSCVSTRDGSTQRQRHITRSSKRGHRTKRERVRKGETYGVAVLKQALVGRN